MKGCDLCDDQPSNEDLFLHSKCHMTAPLQATLETGNDGRRRIVLRCYMPECAREVATFIIYEGESQ